MRLKYKIFWGLVAVGLVMAGISHFTGGRNQAKDPSLQTLAIAGKEIQVKEVMSKDDMYIGLGGRDSLEKDEGMLFTHLWPGKHVYVMRDMRFDLDFIFIKDNKVVDYVENVPADFKGKVKGAADYNRVLEVNAGWIQENGIKIGDEVKKI